MRTNQMICQCKITSFPCAEIAGMTKFHPEGMFWAEADLKVLENKGIRFIEV